MAAVSIERLKEAVERIDELNGELTGTLVIIEHGVHVSVYNHTSNKRSAKVVSWPELTDCFINPLLPTIERATQEVR